MSSASSPLAPRASAVRPRALPAELRRAVSAAPRDASRSAGMSIPSASARSAARPTTDQLRVNRPSPRRRT